MSEQSPRTNGDSGMANIAAQPTQMHEATVPLGELVVSLPHDEHGRPTYEAVLDRMKTAMGYGFSDPTPLIVHDAEGHSWPIIDLLGNKRDLYDQNGGNGPRTVSIVKRTSGSRTDEIDADLVVLDARAWNDRELGGREVRGGAGRYDVRAGEQRNFGAFEVRYDPEAGIMLRALQPGVTVTRMSAEALTPVDQNEAKATLDMEGQTDDVGAAGEEPSQFSEDEADAEMPEATPTEVTGQEGQTAETGEGDAQASVDLADAADAASDEAPQPEDAVEAVDSARGPQMLAEELVQAGDDIIRAVAVTEMLIAKGEAGTQAIIDTLPRLSASPAVRDEVMTRLVKNERVERLLSPETLARVGQDAAVRLVIRTVHTAQNADYLREWPNLMAFVGNTRNSQLISDPELRRALRNQRIDYALPGETRVVDGGYHEFSEPAVYDATSGAYRDETGRIVWRPYSN